MNNIKYYYIKNYNNLDGCVLPSYVEGVISVSDSDDRNNINYNFNFDYKSKLLKILGKDVLYFNNIIKVEYFYNKQILRKIIIQKLLNE